MTSTKPAKAVSNSQIAASCSRTRESGYEIAEGVWLLESGRFSLSMSGEAIDLILKPFLAE